MKECTTHHFACDCREDLFDESLKIHRNLQDWLMKSDDALRLRCGEMTEQEIRTVRAVLTAIATDSGLDG